MRSRDGRDERPIWDDQRLLKLRQRMLSGLFAFGHGTSANLRLTVLEKWQFFVVGETVTRSGCGVFCGAGGGDCIMNGAIETWRWQKLRGMNQR